MGTTVCLLALTAIAGVFTAVRHGAPRYLLLTCCALLMNSCLSITSERTERPAPVSTVTRTETVYVTENGTRVRRVVTVDASGRRYYVDNGRTIYVEHYEY